jgi:hypothetical protein
MIFKDYIKVSSFARKQKKSTAWIYKLIEQNKLTPPAVNIDKTFFVHKDTKINNSK